MNEQNKQIVEAATERWVVGHSDSNTTQDLLLIIDRLDKQLDDLLGAAEPLLNETSILSPTGMGWYTVHESQIHRLGRAWRKAMGKPLLTCDRCSYELHWSKEEMKAGDMCPWCGKGKLRRLVQALKEVNNA